MALSLVDPLPSSLNSGRTMTLGRHRDLRGRTEPRLFTPPLRELTPETSYGFDVIRFARDVVRRPLLPWQEWAAIHIGELLEDGTPRFRQVLLLVARQNGKTELLVILALYWLYVMKVRLIVGTSTNLDLAAESWAKVADLAEDDETLVTEFQRRREANGEKQLELSGRRRYKIGASNRKGPRSLTINKLIMDELREHLTWEAYNAAEPAASTADAQIVMLSNAGDDKSVVLNSLRQSAMEQTDPQLGLMEWSAPDGSEPDDIDAILQANPRVGLGLNIDSILGHAARAKAKGGKELTGYKTEKLCMRVRALDAAIDAGKWHDGRRPGVSLVEVRKRIAVCLDMSPDGLHATLLAGAETAPGIVTLRNVAAWSGVGCSAQLTADLPGWLEELKPRVLGWFPNGPAAVLIASLGKNRPQGWPPAGTKIYEIREEVTGVCMAFAANVAAGRILHPDDALVNAHVTEAEKLGTGDRWRFRRLGEGHVDAAYAAAGADYLARTLPPPLRTKMPSRDAMEAARARANS